MELRGGGGHGLVRREDTSLVWAALAVGLTSVAVSGAYLWYETRLFRRRDSDQRAKSAAASTPPSPSSASSSSTSRVTTLFDAVGNTPLLRIESLSRETGCSILAKAEFMNPGGSVKDRVARNIIIEAEREGKLRPGVSKLVEATAGSTGIALALLGRARGYEVELYLPDNVSTEKVDLLTTLGAKIKIVPIMPMSQPEHFMHYAMSCALADPDAYYCNQFDNLANMRAHYHGTGAEIWEQTNGQVDGVVMGAGTGGTLAGITKYLKEKNPEVVSYLVDPPGSGLFHLVTKGVMFHPQDTMTVEPLSARSFYEGVGVNRQTENFTQVPSSLSHQRVVPLEGHGTDPKEMQVERYDGAFQASEQEGVAMAHHLLRHDGLFVGGSSALNCVGAVKLARKLGPGHTIGTHSLYRPLRVLESLVLTQQRAVTVLCDSGQRYNSRIYNTQWLEERGLSVPHGDDLSFLDGDDTQALRFG